MLALGTTLCGPDFQTDLRQMDSVFVGEACRLTVQPEKQIAIVRPGMTHLTLGPAYFPRVWEGGTMGPESG